MSTQGGSLHTFQTAKTPMLQRHQHGYKDNVHIKNLYSHASINTPTVHPTIHQNCESIPVLSVLVYHHLRTQTY